MVYYFQESLGGNSRTSMLATISPANTHLDETLATLRYACQARSIVNRARVNENPHDRLIRELKAEVERLRALRKDYERTSSSSIQFDELSNQSQELEELREKLSSTESQLQEAQMNWERKFVEVKRCQMEELAAVEKRKEELESHVRVLETLEVDVKLSPVTTNFLEEVDGILSNATSCETLDHACDLEYLSQLSNMAGYDLEFVPSNGTVAVYDNKLSRQTSCSWSDLESISTCNDLEILLNMSHWSGSKQKKKVSKSEVVSSMNQIYKSLATLRPAVEEADLQLLFAKLNKTLQSFETALLNAANRTGNAPKTVTFNV